MKATKTIFIPVKKGRQLTLARWAAERKKEYEEEGFTFDHEIIIRDASGEPEYRQLYFTKKGD